MTVATYSIQVTLPALNITTIYGHDVFFESSLTHPSQIYEVYLCDIRIALLFVVDD
jgi:hypothetical protein